MSRLTAQSKLNLNIVKEAVKECFKGNKVLQDLTLAQAILEGGLYNTPPSGLALNHCNLFGMKPGKLIPTGTNGIVYLMTTECNKDKCWKESQPFLSNLNIEDSFKQHELLFTSLERYKPLLNAQTFQDAAKIVRLCGYATDPSYTQKLIDIHNKIK